MWFKLCVYIYMYESCCTNRHVTVISWIDFLQTQFLKKNISYIYFQRQTPASPLQIKMCVSRDCLVAWRVYCDSLYSLSAHKDTEHAVPSGTIWHKIHSPLQTAVFWLSNCPLCATRLFHSPQCHRDMCHRDICLPILWLVRQRKRVFCHCRGSLKGGGCRLYPHPQNLKPKTHRCRLDEIISFRWFFVSIFLEFCCLYLTVNILVMHLRYPFRDQQDIYWMSHL